VSEEDWELAGVVMAVSDATRARVRRVLETEAAKRNLGRAHAEAERSAVVEEHREERMVLAAVRAVQRGLAEGGRVPHNELRRRLSSRYRPFFDDAIERLVSVGAVVVGGDEEGKWYQCRDE
jgi:hypothetical protein